MAHSSNIYYSKMYLKKKERKKNKLFPLEQQKIQSPSLIAQLTIWRNWLGILDIDTQ